MVSSFCFISMSLTWMMIPEFRRKIKRKVVCQFPIEVIDNLLKHFFYVGHQFVSANALSSGI